MHRDRAQHPYVAPDGRRDIYDVVDGDDRDHDGAADHAGPAYAEPRCDDDANADGGANDRRAVADVVRLAVVYARAESNAHFGTDAATGRVTATDAVAAAAGLRRAFRRVGFGFVQHRTRRDAHVRSGEPRC